MQKKYLKKDRIIQVAIILVLILTTFIYVKTMEDKDMVIIETSLGKIKIELAEKEAPITVANFKKYVDSGFYDDLVFHRVMSGFMIQGGGFYSDGQQKQTNNPIVLESNNGLKTIWALSQWHEQQIRIALQVNFL